MQFGQTASLEALLACSSLSADHRPGVKLTSCYSIAVDAIVRVIRLPFFFSNFWSDYAFFFYFKLICPPLNDLIKNLTKLSFIKLDIIKLNIIKLSMIKLTIIKLNIIKINII